MERAGSSSGALLEVEEAPKPTDVFVVEKAKSGRATLRTDVRNLRHSFDGFWAKYVKNNFVMFKEYC